MIIRCLWCVVMSSDSGELSLFEKISLFIPGFRGYKEKELRRESDRLVREKIYSNLDEAERAFREVLTYMVRPVPDDIMSLVDIVIYRIQEIKDSVRFAESGYSGFFDREKVREDDLDKILRHDLKLLRISDKVLKDVKELSSKGFNVPDARNRLMMIIEALKVIREAFSMRRDILKGYEKLGEEG